MVFRSTILIKSSTFSDHIRDMRNALLIFAVIYFVVEILQQFVFKKRLTDTLDKQLGSIRKKKTDFLCAESQDSACRYQVTSDLFWSNG